MDTVIIIGHEPLWQHGDECGISVFQGSGSGRQSGTGVSVRSYARDYLKRPERTLVVGISCSGNTESVVKGLEAARQAGALATESPAGVKPK